MEGNGYYMRREDYTKIFKWMYRNGRPLDLARWQFHFENGSKEELIKVLSAYQNEDGGFGHALEMDSWNENSSPIQTWCATEILKEIQFTDKKHPMVQNILNYLKKSIDTDKQLWLAEIPSNNHYPHASWWTYEEETVMEWGNNPTASLLGFILYFLNKEDEFYQKAYHIAQRMVSEFIYTKNMDMHEISCYIQFYCYIKQGEIEIENLVAYENKLKELVSTSINRNTKEWGITYTCTPSRFVRDPASIFYEDNKELVDYECEFILTSRNEQGVWDIAYNWGKYPDEFAISKNWTKGSLAIENMLFLKNFKRFTGIS